VSTTKSIETPGGGDGNGLAEKLLGLPGFRVLCVTETDSEVLVEIETTADVTGCAACGQRAEAKDRMPIAVRDLPCFGRPARLVWHKRRWRCRDVDCDAKTWTETIEQVTPRAVMTRRAGAEACRQVGANARPVSQVADELGVCWWTVMNAVIEHGTPLVDHPDRVGEVRQLGVDETSWLRANRYHSTLYATGLVDLDAHILIDMVEGNSADDLRRWVNAQDSGWLEEIDTIATDLAESYRAGLDNEHLASATRVADPFHVVRVANRCVDKVRRRVQNETLNHRGRKHDPLYRIRKLLLTGSERLDQRGTDRMLLGLRVGDPDDEVLGAWLAKESVRDIYLTDEPDEATTLMTRPSPAARTTTSTRSTRWVARSSRGAPRSSTTTTPARRTGRPRA
jgi:transposase